MQANLEQLYTKWKKRLDHQDREYARKALAAQAVSEASMADGMIQSSILPRVHSADFVHSKYMHRSSTDAIQTTASWLSRSAGVTNTPPSKNKADIENDLRRISHLLKESPRILAAASDIARQNGAQLRRQRPDTANSLKRKYSGENTLTDSPTNPMKLLASISSHAAPVPVLETENKSQPINRSVSIGDLEDAQAFVHFLKSMS